MNKKSLTSEQIGRGGGVKTITVKREDCEEIGENLYLWKPPTDEIPYNLEILEFNICTNG